MWGVCVGGGGGGQAKIAQCVKAYIMNISIKPQTHRAHSA